MWTLQQKQKYLRENLDKDQFQQFFQFLEDQIGNFNIEQWSDDFIVKLVHKFKKKKQEDNKNLETSFYQYQANQALSAVASMILGQEIQKIKNQDTKQQVFKKQKKEESKSQADKRVSFKKQPQRKEVSQKEPEKGQSAIQFLNQIVKKPPEKEKKVIEEERRLKTQTNQQFKTYSPTVRPEQPSMNEFATNQFWNIGSTNKSNKNSKANQDFAAFQFWSQPSSSPANAKTVQFDNFSDKAESKYQKPPSQNQIQVYPQKQPQNNPYPAVSFDDLLASCDKQKGPSPYQKKSNPAQVVVQKQVERKSENEKRSKSQTAQKIESKSEKSVKRKKKTAKVLYDGQIILKKEFQGTVKCFPSADRKKLKDPTLKAKIVGHQIVKRTFLMPDYTMYIVKIDPLNISLKRNYEDFQRLRDTLKRLFPGIKLAYLESNSWFSATSQQFISNQKVMLQFFLNDLIKNPEIRNSKILQDFLTLTDHKTIKRKFEEWDKLQAPKAIQELCLIGGRVEINLSQQQRLYQQNFKKYHDKINDFLDKHQRLTHTLSQQLKEVQSTEEKLIQLCKIMMDDTVYFNERVYDLQLDRINDALKFIHTIYKEETKSTVFRQNRLQEMIEPFVKYERENIKELSELIELQQDFFKTYLKRSNSQKIDEKIPYTSDKIKMYKSGILQQSKNIIVLKYQAGFLSNQMCYQGYRVIETLGDKYLDLFRSYAEQCREHESKLLQFWSSGLYRNNSMIV